MATLSLKGIGKIYPSGVEAVKDFNLEIADREFIIFVGPSGCGKSTTLRMIAGLEDITSGTLAIDGAQMNDVAPRDRDISMVFQSYALFPHMTVYDNMAFGLKLKKLPKKVIDEKVREAAKILDLEDLLKRKPKALSGGQQQRVAMGRAIVRRPKVFLMDEPLSNLDAKLRVQMRTEIAKLHHSLNATIIYVTHDQTEAMTLGTRIVVMKEGLIQQVDTPRNLYEKPANIFVAGFMGSPQMNFLDADISFSGEDAAADIGGTKLPLTKEQSLCLKQAGCGGKKVTLGIRPEDIAVALTAQEAFPFRAPLAVYELVGAESYLHFDIADTPLCARTDADTPLRVGDTVHAAFPAEKIHLFDKESTLRIA